MIKKYNIKKNETINIPDNVSCIGFFDGVHLGHQALIKKTVELADKLNVEPYLITFFPDPADIISNKKTKHINSLNTRIKLFEKFGIKGVIIIEFDKDVMSIDKKEFVDKYLKKLNLKSLVCGFDFHYGY
ncbi:MAG: adenylyltransferase/cytidyltransferase family protein, partial [Erysipelotrichaceae bacterium]|nr:adenylyltransferase/cytidyltransferase family protein [Erysipelotrichaceae bacterium]